MTSTQSEIARVRDHIGRAQAFMEGGDAQQRTATQVATRSFLRGELERYRAHGRFPQNRDFPASRVPYFVDADGTHCAVAHLMSLTGEGALVAEVARENNHARVAELADDPRFIAWLERVGLTVEEAARIQPSYTWAGAYCICTLAMGDGGAGSATSTAWVGTAISPNTVHVDEVRGADGGIVDTNVTVNTTFALGTGTRILGVTTGSTSSVISTLESVDGGIDVTGATCGYPAQLMQILDLGIISKQEALAMADRGKVDCQQALQAIDACWTSDEACTYQSRFGVPARSNGGVVIPDGGVVPDDDATAPPGDAESSAPIAKDAGRQRDAETATDSGTSTATASTDSDGGGCNSSGTPVGGALMASGAIAALVAARSRRMRRSA